MTFNEYQVLLGATARSPEDVFPDVTDLEQLSKASRKIAAAVHPDVNPQNTADADVVFKRLKVWEQRAEEKIKAGTWGDGRRYPEFSFRAGSGIRYDVFGLSRREALFDSLEVASGDNDLLMHVARKERYESLINTTVHILKIMAGRGAPRLVDVISLQGRKSYVTTDIPEGFVTVASVMEAHPDGVPPRMMIPWVCSLLSVIKLAQHGMYVHGSINPATWFVHKVTAASLLVDWHYATMIGKPVVYSNATYDAYLPWEIREEKPVDRGTDMAAAMMVFKSAIGVQDTPIELDDLVHEHFREGRARPTDPDATYARLARIGLKR